MYLKYGKGHCKLSTKTGSLIITGFLRVVDCKKATMEIIKILVDSGVYKLEKSISLEKIIEKNFKVVCYNVSINEQDLYNGKEMNSTKYIYNKAIKLTIIDSTKLYYVYYSDTFPKLEYDTNQKQYKYSYIKMDEFNEDKRGAKKIQLVTIMRKGHKLFLQNISNDIYELICMWLSNNTTITNNITQIKENKKKIESNNNELIDFDY